MTEAGERRGEGRDDRLEEQTQGELQQEEANKQKQMVKIEDGEHVRGRQEVEVSHSLVWSGSSPRTGPPTGPSDNTQHNQRAGPQNFPFLRLCCTGAPTHGQWRHRQDVCAPTQ